MIGLFYDTESSGMPDWHRPSSDPHQPHIVQLAAHLADMESQKVLQTIDLTVKPDGWEIEPGAAEVHGITTEMAIAIGIPEEQAVDIFLSLWLRSDIRVAHNEQFDARMLRIAMKRIFPDDGNLHDLWKGGDKLCTARRSTAIVNLPPTPKMLRAGRKHPKTPTLAEAYRFFFHKDFEGAHQAIADVNACMAIHWEIDRFEADVAHG